MLGQQEDVNVWCSLRSLRYCGWHTGLTIEHSNLFKIGQSITGNRYLIASLWRVMVFVSNWLHSSIRPHTPVGVYMSIGSYLTVIGRGLPFHIYTNGKEDRKWRLIELDCGGGRNDLIRLLWIGFFLLIESRGLDTMTWQVDLMYWYGMPDNKNLRCVINFSIDNII